jgi:hypothetical protein
LACADSRGFEAGDRGSEGVGEPLGVTSLIAASGFIVFSSLICCDFESILDIVKGRKRGREEDEEEREVSWRSSVLVNFYSWGSLKPLYRDAVES